MNLETTEFYLEQLPVGSYRNFCYIAGDKNTGEAVVFDPGWEIEKIIGLLESRSASLKLIINTHAHFDHIQGNQELQSLTGAKVAMHTSSKAKKDISINDGDIVKVGKSIILRFIHTPGHSPESMCVIINNKGLLTGDTLFIGECGRVDLPGGSAEELYESFQKIKTLDRDLIVFPGHDYGPKQATTLGEQITTNYTLADRSCEDFVRFMSSP